MRQTAWLLFIAMLSVGIALWMPKNIEADENTARYLVMQNQLVFEYTNEQPYTILRPMCWDATLGWCDSGMDESAHREAYLIDFDLRRHGVIMSNSSGCWVWWFLDSYGEDNNPHIQDDYWVQCQDYFQNIGR